MDDRRQLTESRQAERGVAQTSVPPAPCAAPDPKFGVPSRRGRARPRRLPISKVRLRRNDWFRWHSRLSNSEPYDAASGHISGDLPSECGQPSDAASRHTHTHTSADHQSDFGRQPTAIDRQTFRRIVSAAACHGARGVCHFRVHFNCLRTSQYLCSALCPLSESNARWPTVASTMAVALDD